MHSDPEAFLEHFHSKFPGTCSDVFSQGRIQSKKSSYSLLSELVPKSDEAIHVLDLCCGDGYLSKLIAGDGTQNRSIIGLDRSKAELQLAASKHAAGGIHYVLGNASSLPLESQSMDFVLCHMSLMLVDNIELVLSEASRVLKPSGIFGAVIGTGVQNGDAYEIFSNLCAQILDKYEIDMPYLGDARVRKPFKIKSIIAKIKQFESDVQFDEYRINFDSKIENLWKVVYYSYTPHFMNQQAQAELRTLFFEQASKLQNKSGAIPCSMNVFRIICRKKESSSPYE